jgi:hypothetical protein
VSRKKQNALLEVVKLKFLNPSFSAIVENHLMVGASYKISSPLTFHAALELGLNKSETASNSSLIANEYNGSTSQLSTTLVHVAVSYTL